MVIKSATYALAGEIEHLIEIHCGVNYAFENYEDYYAVRDIFYNAVNKALDGREKDMIKRKAEDP